MSGRPILVTGISGFIAKHCALELLRHGHAVRGTVRRMAKADETRATLARHVDTARLGFTQADLLDDAGWAQAMDGVGGVLHLASPFPADEPDEADDLIRPAVEGTLRVLRAAVAAGVPRVVQTSSMAAVFGGRLGPPAPVLTEDDWTDLAHPGLSTYTRSKTLAERAAREFVRTEGGALHFSTVNPGFVLGPVLDDDIGTSAEVIRMFLRGKYPGTPRLWFSVVDVRDVARMHRLALECAEPSGGRYLAVSDVVRFLEIARPIREQLGAVARKVPRRELPDWLVRLVAIIDRPVRTIVPDLGLSYRVDNSRTRRGLGVEFIPVGQSAPAMASSLIEQALV